MVKGQSYFKALPECQTKKDAQAAEDLAKTQARAGKLNTQAERTTLAAFVHGQFVNWSKDTHGSAWHQNVVKSYLPPILSFFEDKTLAEISPFDVERFKLHIKNTPARSHKNDEGEWQYKPRAAASVNLSLAVVSAIFTAATMSGILTENPCAKVKPLTVDNARERVLEPDEEKRLFEILRERHEVTDSHLWPLVQMAMYTGLRKSELLTLRRDEVNFEKNEIRRATSKNKRRRRVTMSAVVRQIVEHELDSHSFEFVFINPATGKPFVDVKKGWAAACKQAGIADLHWHDLRHTFASRLIEAGATPVETRDLLGQTSLRMTNRYTHSSEAGRIKAVESLADRRKAG
jgi:integrase